MRKNITLGVKIDASKKDEIIKLYKSLGYTSFNKYCQDLLDRELNDNSSMIKTMDETNYMTKQIYESMTMSNAINYRFFMLLLDTVKHLSNDLKTKKSKELLRQIFRVAAFDLLNNSQINLYNDIHDLEEEIKNEGKDEYFKKREHFDIYRYHRKTPVNSLKENADEKEI